MSELKNSFTYKDLVIEHEKNPDGTYNICVSNKTRRICLNNVKLGIHFSSNYEILENIRNTGIYIDGPDFMDITSRIQLEYMKEKNRMSCRSLGFITLGLKEYELLDCNNSFTIYYTVTRNDHEEEEYVDIYEGHAEVRHIIDKWLGDDVYVFTNTYGQTFVTNDVAEMIEWFAKEDKGIKSESLAKHLIRALLRNAKNEEGYVYEGFYPDGYKRGVLAYPMVDNSCDATVLQKFYQWAKANYNENLDYVLANMAFSMAKALAIAVRMKKDIFEDRIIINTGKKRVGKSTVQKSIINALGLIHNKVRYLGDNTIKTQERLRNLLSITMAPLFLDEIMSRGFMTIADLILASVTETSIIGLHASRVGKDFSDVFYSMRSIVINTNLPQGKIIEILGRENIDAYSRRILILNWKDEKTKAKSPFDTDSHLMGCLIQLWDDYDIRQDLLNSNDLFELTFKLLDAFHIMFNVDTQPYEDAVARVYNEYIENEGSWEISSEEAIVSEAYRIARNVLGTQSLSPAKVINAIIDNTAIFDVYPYKARYNDSIEKELREFEELITDLGFNISDIEGDVQVNDETAQLLKRVFKMINNEGIYAFLIKPRSKTGLLKDFPHELMGVKPQKINGQYYFRIGISEFLRFMLMHRISEPEDGNNEETVMDHDNNPEGGMNQGNNNEPDQGTNQGSGQEPSAGSG
jgi:hypothetical protein